MLSVFNINFLTNKGLLDIPILFLSRYILDHKEGYYTGLREVSQRGNWKDWILFMLKAIENTSNLTFNKINDIMSAKDDILQYIIEGKQSFKSPELLIDSIFNHPFTKVKHLVESGIYAENTARNYLNRLCDLDVMEKKIIEGQHYYLNLELYKILSD